MFSKSIRTLKSDIENGVKDVGESEILSYNYLTRMVKLDNGPR